MLNMILVSTSTIIRRLALYSRYITLRRWLSSVFAEPGDIFGAFVEGINSQISNIVNISNTLFIRYSSEISVENRRTNDPFIRSPPFDVASPIIPTPYVKPSDGYTITPTPSQIDANTVSGNLYYVIHDANGSNTLKKAALGSPLKQWVPVLDPFFGKMTVQYAYYTIPAEGLVLLNFDVTMYELNNITIDTSIAINLPVLARGTEQYEAALTGEARYEGFDLGEFGGSFMNGRVMAASDRLIFYLYAFELNMTYRLRGQISYKLEDRSEDSRTP